MSSAAHLETGGIGPEFNSQSGNWDVLELRVREAGSSPGLSTRPVISHGFPKKDGEADGTLDVALQIFDSKLMTCTEPNTKPKRRGS